MATVPWKFDKIMIGTAKKPLYWSSRALVSGGGTFGTAWQKGQLRLLENDEN